MKLEAIFTIDMATKSISKMAEKNPMWKGGIDRTNYLHRLVYKEWNIPRVCAKCGACKSIDIHHINKVNSDNTRENIMVLCRSCHNLIHNRKKGFYKECKYCKREIYIKQYQKDRKKYCSRYCLAKDILVPAGINTRF